MKVSNRFLLGGEIVTSKDFLDKMEIHENEKNKVKPEISNTNENIPRKRGRPSKKKKFLSEDENISVDLDLSADQNFVEKIYLEDELEEILDDSIVTRNIEDDEENLLDYEERLYS
jgi:hypothetical protein